MTGERPPRSQPRLVGANIEHAGRHNQQIVLHAVRVAGTATRPEIAAVTGLTPATVSNITNRLLDDGYLRRAGQRRGGRGQPATRLTVNPAGAFSVGVNVDRDHLAMVAVDFEGTVRARVTCDAAFPAPDDVRAFYARKLCPLLAEAGVEPASVVGVGVALPDDLGRVDLPGRPPDYDRWSTTDVADLFAGPLDVPVRIENDAAAAAIGEMQFGLGQHYSSFLYLLFTFGLGGGVVVNSLYDRGVNGRSGEIGFLLVDDGRGGTVPLQNVASLAGLRRTLAEAGLPDLCDGEPDLRDARVAAAVHDWIGRAAQALVQPLIAAGCLLDPGAILLGGRLPSALVERLAARTNALMRRHGAHLPVIAPIKVASMAEDAAAVGAALLAFGHLLLPADNVLARDAADVEARAGAGMA